MTPAEAIQKLVSLGIACNYEKPKNSMSEMFGAMSLDPEGMEDFSQVGFNREHLDEEPSKAPKKLPKNHVAVITDAKRLVGLNFLLLVRHIPPSFDTYFRGCLLIASVEKGELVFRFDDAPYSVDGMKCSVQLEYLKDIKMAEAMLVLNTTLGTYAIQIPESFG